MTPDITEQSTICVAGDWHGVGHAAVERIAHAGRCGAALIVHAGDFGIARPKIADRFIGAVGRALTASNLTVWIVPGNHDDWDIVESLPAIDSGLQKLTNRIFVIPRAHRWHWAGNTWLGLSGAVSVDRHRLAPGRTWWPQEAMTDADVDAAIAPGPVDVVVSHDAPSAAHVPGLERQSSWPAEVLLDAARHRERLQSVAVRTRPRHWFHGHHHHRYKTSIALGATDSQPRGNDVLTVQGLADQRSAIAANLVFVRADGELIRG